MGSYPEETLGAQHTQAHILTPGLLLTMSDIRKHEMT